MSAAHTPGPWRLHHYGYYEHNGQSNKLYLIDSAAGDICDCVDEGDAPLIAAAPELLQALERVTDALQDICCHSVIPEARAAIAKARGAA